MTGPCVERVTWDEVAQMCTHLARRLEGCTFDAILGIARGGLVPAALLAQELRVRNVLVAAVASYEGDRRGDIDFLQFPSQRELGARRVLVADDIWDTGRTLHAVRERATASGARTTVAVLHYKPTQSLHPQEQPDLWCRETDAWVIYPWERDT